MLTFLTLALGLVLLVGGGALLVRGASDIATSLGISPLVVGLTVVGFGTSSPELVVNIIGAARGATDLAFGNVVGSNISNLALVLGAAALMSPITIQGDLVRREVPLLLLATGIITVMALDLPLEGEPSVIGRSDSIVLFLLFGIFLYISVMDLVHARPGDALLADIEESAIVAPERRLGLPIVSIVAGCVMLFFGGELTVTNGVSLAERLQVSATVIGLFVVAIGTSLPELVTSIIAAMKRESDLALGNVVGSNLFNSLAVLPAGGVIGRIPVSVAGIMDLVFSLLLAAALIPIFLLRQATLGRASGATLVLLYVGYAAFRINQAS